MTEVHRIPVTDDEAVAAVHHPADGDGWFVPCHGFRSDKSGSYERRCRRAVEAGYDAIRFDFRGCGESDGAFADSTLGARLADLEAVLEYVDPSRCVLFGSSFGAKVAMHAAATVAADRVEAVIARAPVTYNRAFDDYRDTVASDGELTFEDGERIDERFFTDLDRHPFTAVERDLDVPVAIFHGDADASVPVADSRRAAAALETDVLLQTYAGEGHLFSNAAERHLLAVAFAWLEGMAV
ncbi:alpha/beta hydrolase family protein [Halopiger goleimassiliensis]|uniref:alpha/beta hydrolase family protein n=1 Tax=Halopiger goleimassiliensis TaxID=1293048 RepID=UPI000677AD88|nr:alpha/beta fold hydrolase [Halopiger goleimassiliensis]